MGHNGISRRLTFGAIGLAVSFFCLGASANAANIQVTTLAGDDSAGSLHAAMDTANASPATKDSITFAPGLAGQISLFADLPALAGPVEITGPGSEKVVVEGKDGSTFHRMFQTSHDLTLTGLDLERGSNLNGGAISSTDSDLALNDVHVGNSHSYTGKGGGIHVEGGSLDIENSAIFANLAPEGAGLWINGTTSVSISNTQIFANQAYFFFAPGPNPVPNVGGGFLIKNSGSLEVRESVIRENVANSAGFAFSIEDVQNVTISDTFVTNNSISFVDFPEGFDYFGTARIVADRTTITDSQFTDNYSPSILAGLQVIGPVTISRSLIAGNESNSLYTGLALGEVIDENLPPNNVTATVANTTITGNKGTTLGSGLMSSVSRLNLDSSTISGNSILFPALPAANSSGLLQLNGTATLTNSIVSGNGATDISALGTISVPNGPSQEFGGSVEGSYNLIGTVTGEPFKDLVAGTNIVSNFPKLGPLGYNSDGKTQTMEPAPDSPVIDQGLSSLATDQNGLPRPVAFGWLSKPSGGNRADIGAVEVQSLTAPANRFTIGKVKPNRKKGTATVKVTVPWSGKVQLRGSKTVKPLSRSTEKGATVTLIVKARGKAAKALKKKRKAKVKATITYTSAGITPLTKSKAVKLFKKKIRKKAKKN